MDPEHSSGDYEGFLSAGRRDAARVQRMLMFQWRLLCSGQDPQLVGQYGHGLGLSFDESQRLDDDLRINKAVLTWGQLHERCGRHLSYFVSRKARAPTINTLLDMLNAGGEVAVVALLQQRKQLTPTELRDLRKSPEHLAKLRGLAPELLPEDASTSPTPSSQEAPTEEEPAQATIIQLPLADAEQGPTKGRSKYFDWDEFLEEGGPLGFEVDTFAPECLDIFSASWRDD